VRFGLESTRTSGSRVAASMGRCPPPSPPGWLRQRFVDRAQGPDAERGRRVAVPESRTSPVDRHQVPGDQLSRRQMESREPHDHSTMRRCGREDLVTRTTECRRRPDDRLAISSSARVETPGRPLQVPPEARTPPTTRRAAIASSQPRLSCATTWRLRSPGTAIIDYCQAPAGARTNTSPARPRVPSEVCVAARLHQRLGSLGTLHTVADEPLVSSERRATQSRESIRSETANSRTRRAGVGVVSISSSARADHRAG